MSSVREIRRDREKEIAEDTAKAFAEHVVTVEHEHGLYRHYRCGRPGTGNYSFHIVTFPGRLIVCGDIGDMVWERLPDMLEWASSSIDSIGYFAEKVWRSIATQEWSEDICREAIEEEYRSAIADTEGLEPKEIAKETAKADEIKDELLRAIDNGEHAFAQAYYESDWYGGDFPNTRDNTHEFLRCREAVRWFLKWYKAREVAAK